MPPVKKKSALDQQKLLWTFVLGPLSTSSSVAEVHPQALREPSPSPRAHQQAPVSL